MSTYSARVFNPNDPDQERATHTVLGGFASTDAAWQAVEDFLRSDPRWAGDSDVLDAAAAQRRAAPSVASDLWLTTHPDGAGHPVAVRVVPDGT